MLLIGVLNTITALALVALMVVYCVYKSRKSALYNTECVLCGVCVAAAAADGKQCNVDDMPSDMLFRVQSGARQLCIGIV